tara:strand:+ start:174415 stop:177390 length:2976 start_codon:yes stop_codon:yes gene_type:complete
MSECLDAEEALELLEHRLSNAVRAEFEQHVDGCEACRHFLAEVVRGQSTLGDLPSVEPTIADAERQFRAGQQVGRYSLIRIAGQGGMAVVYLAYDPELDRNVALKLLRGSSTDKHKDRLRREAQAMAKVHHANVAQVFDVGSHDGEVFIAMEFVAGETLTSWLASEKRAWKEIVEAFADAGRGLQAAHDANLVHRDFKPDNVLIAEADGRVCVCDFGLVSPLGKTEEPLPDSKGKPEQLTQTGTVLGTPAYMAPEQMLGEAANARGDQFSFCVALFEALYEARPYAGETADDVRGNAIAGRISAATNTTVPQRVRAVLARGLSGDPAKRFPSIRILLTQLEKAASPRRRWRYGVAAALVASLGIGAWGLAHKSDAAIAPCGGAAQALADVWSDTRRGEVLAARPSQTSEPTMLQSLASRFVSRVDERADAWTTQHTQACKATRVHKHQSQEHLALRMACLEEQRIGLQAFLGEVDASDSSSLDRAVQSLDALAHPRECANLATLESRAPSLKSANNSEFTVVRQNIAKVQAKMQLGQASSALALAQEEMPTVLATGDMHLIAQARTQLASLLEEAGALGEAKTMYETALSEAVAAEDEMLVATVWIGLVHLVGYAQQEHEMARQLVTVAEVALRRVPKHDALALRLRGTVAMLASSEDKLEQAEEGFRAVSKGYEQSLGAFHPRTLNALHNLGDVLRRRGKLEEARGIWLELLRTQEERFGRDHSSVASTLIQLAHDEYQRGLIPQALAKYQRALAIRVHALGPQSPKVAASHTTVGLALSATGDYSAAREHHSKALQIWQSTLGPNHGNVAIALNNLASTEFRDGNLDAAEALYKQSYERKKSNLGATHASVAFPLFNLGLVIKERTGDCEQAKLHWQEVLTIREASLDSEHPHLAFPLTSLGECAVEEGDSTGARKLLERALSIRTKHQSSAVVTAETRFALAKALWPERAERGRALELATTARDALIGQPEQDEFRDRITQWLSSRLP